MSSNSYLMRAIVALLLLNPMEMQSAGRNKYCVIVIILKAILGMIVTD